MTGTPTSADSPRLAIFTSVLTGGGIQRSMRDLAIALVNTGYQVDLIVCHGDTDTERELSRSGVRCIILARSAPLIGRALALRADPAAWRLLMRPTLAPLKSSTKLRYLASLRDYLRNTPPDALVAAATNCNLVAIWAQLLARATTRLTIVEHNMLSKRIENGRHKWRWRCIGPLVAHTYRQADAIGAVSRAVANDLAHISGIDSTDIHFLFNPNINDGLRQGRQQPIDHPWFKQKNCPIVLSVGRLAPQKDHATLLRAFAQVLKTRPARLVIVGDGPLRDTLQAQCVSSGIENAVTFVGWQTNPFAYMASADVLVLSSWWEGLPGVLIQALACGCPVVATDCPGGSAEILDGGQYGELVPVGDARAIANAIVEILAYPPNRKELIAHGETFSDKKAAQCYARVMLDNPARVIDSQSNGTQEAETQR